MKVSLAQFSPVWLDKSKTIQLVCNQIEEAANVQSDLIVFSEAFLPGYPFWLSFTHGSLFESPLQKRLHAHYLSQSIDLESNDLNPILDLCKKHQINCYLGIIEKAHDRSKHSLYCSLLFINRDGQIKSNQRKLQPTYEERLCWSQGDGHGLRVHQDGDFYLGGLNCWENWMPLARTALYGDGENLHIAVWPGSIRNTEDITRFMAKEGRSYVVSVSSRMTKDQIPNTLPNYDDWIDLAPNLLADGGSCVANPDGTWLLEPQSDEGLYHVELDIQKVYQERQNFDATGHYSRPDITELIVNRKRQRITRFTE